MKMARTVGVMKMCQWIRLNPGHGTLCNTVQNVQRLHPAHQSGQAKALCQMRQLHLLLRLLM
jgi:hypothetical protein